MIDRERSKSCGFPTAALQSCVDVWTALHERSEPRSVRRFAFCHFAPRRQSSTEISESILRGDLDKTIVAFALGIAWRNSRGCWSTSALDEIPLARRRDRQKAWAASILKGARRGPASLGATEPKSGQGNQSPAQQNPSPVQQNPNPAQQNPNPSQRNPNRSSFRESWLLNRLSPISARFCGGMTFA